MAYTDIPTVSVGDLYTAANFNTHLRDNFAASIPDAFTAKGDIAFGAGADTIGILALGTAGQWLAVDSAQTLGVKWANVTSFFDMFTYGAYSCASLDSAHMSTAALAYREPIVDIHTSFGLPDTLSRVFLGSLTSFYWDSFQGGGDENGYVCLTALNDCGEVYILNRLYGVGSDETKWADNTQAGLFRCNYEGALDINWTQDLNLGVTVKIWGYA